MTGRYPRRFGKYVLLKPLAKGGMGEIYVAAAGEIGGFEKLCVIKKVIAEKADRAKANRFLDEAKVVLRLSHSALVNTFDAGDVDGEFYIAMELVEGKDLREVWNRCVRTRQRIPLDVALHVVREVARALAYVHAYGDLRLVHRDVAPPNILLAYVGDVKLTDFGLARSVLKQEHTAPGVVFGRAAYLAPEQARGEVADARTDIYTLGIVLWELLTGQQFLQLAGLDPAAALAIVRHPKLMPPSVRAPWISPALDRVVLRALAPERNQRFQTAEEMRHALAEVIAEVAPRADAARVAEFLRTIYPDTIQEENDEREQFLREVIPAFRAGRGEDLLFPDPVRPPDAAPPDAAPVATPEPPKPPPPPPIARARTAPRLPGVTPALGLSSDRDSGASPPAVGAVLGRYRLKRRLLAGLAGTLYVAQASDGAPVGSVFVLADLRGAARERVDRCCQVARRAAQLGGAHVAAVAEVGQTSEGTVYVAREPLDGEDLGALLVRERRLEAGRAIPVALQLCRALGAAHAGGLVHGGLRPESVLLTTRAGQADFVKVVDFGLREHPGALPAGFSGADYRAPEQAAGAAPDARADVYALGALLYEMVTGAPVHPGPLARREAPQSPRMFRPDLPESLERVILAALDPDPARRLGSMPAFEQALAQAARSDPREANGAAADRRSARRQAAFRAITELDATPPPADARPPVPPVARAGAPTPREVPQAAMPPAVGPVELSPQSPLPAFPTGVLPAATPPVGGALMAGGADAVRARRRRLLGVAAVLIAVVAGALVMLASEPARAPVGDQPAEKAP